jgi:hypothetical protein
MTFGDVDDAAWAQQGSTFEISIAPNFEASPRETLNENRAGER